MIAQFFFYIFFEMDSTLNAVESSVLVLHWHAIPMPTVNRNFTEKAKPMSWCCVQWNNGTAQPNSA